ncbi:MAG: allantoinase AllB [Chloroflexota bacterium]
MPRHDLIIRNVTVVDPAGIARADIACDGGMIVAIAPDAPGEATETIDGSGLHAFPGVVDAHVHFNEPGRTHWEGWATGSRALAAGGGTVAIDMPLNSSPPVLDTAAFRDKAVAAAASSLVDFALWGGLTPDSLGALDDLAAAGVAGFKAFMSNSGIDEFRAADDATLWEGMAAAARLGLPVAVHAENDAIAGALGARFRARGRTSWADWTASRPVLAETEAIARAIHLAADARCALHVVHVSSGAGVALIAAARARGQDVTAETCPHYLTLTGADLETLGALAKCAPPLRDEAEQAALWAALAAGDIQTVASDHSPSDPALKRGADAFAVWGGIAGVQSTLPLLLTGGVHDRGLSPVLVAEVTAAAPASRFRLPGKGRIAPGFDADIALVDLAANWTFDPGDQQDRHRQNPYAGRAMRGRPIRTIRRSQTIWRDGVPAAGAGGRLLRPTAR